MSVATVNGLYLPIELGQKILLAMEGVPKNHFAARFLYLSQKIFFRCIFMNTELKSPFPIGFQPRFTQQPVKSTISHESRKYSAPKINTQKQKIIIFSVRKWNNFFVF